MALINSFVGCATQSTSRVCCGGNLNTYSVYAMMAVARREIRTANLEWERTRLHAGPDALPALNNGIGEMG